MRSGRLYEFMPSSYSVLIDVAGEGGSGWTKGAAGGGAIGRDWRSDHLRSSHLRSRQHSRAIRWRRTTTSSGARPSLDAGVGGMSDAAVTGIDDDIGGKVGVLGGEMSEGQEG